jgi:acetylglutamate kinase
MKPPSARPAREGGWSGAGHRPWVVKLGGRLCEDPRARAGLAEACAALGEPLVLVHGGGAQVSRMQQALGLEPRFVEGRRITSAEDLEVVEMALSGAVNQTLVRELVAAGRRAVGVSGCDAGLVRCELQPGLGLVGMPAHVEPRLLEMLLAAGYTPVVSPVSLGPDGGAVNVNADEVACALAVALGAERLLLLSDVDGVRVEGEWRLELRGQDVERLIESGQVTHGMVPKLRAAAVATSRGVGEVRIAGFDGAPLREIQGTRVSAEAPGSLAEPSGPRA